VGGVVRAYSSKAKEYLHLIPEVHAGGFFEREAHVEHRGKGMAVLVRVRPMSSRVLVYFVAEEVCSPFARDLVESMIDTVLHGHTVGDWLGHANRPHDVFSGDFFFTLTRPGVVQVVLGDVEGKGVTSAVLATYAAGVISSHIQNAASVEDALYAINRALAARRIEGLVSAVIVEVHRDVSSGKRVADIYCAGGSPPVVILGDKAEALHEQSTPLGLHKGFAPAVLRVDQGFMVLATDGVYETRSGDDISSKFTEWVEYLQELNIPESKPTPSDILDGFVWGAGDTLVDDASIVCMDVGG